MAEKPNIHTLTPTQGALLAAMVDLLGDGIEMLEADIVSQTEATKTDVVYVAKAGAIFGLFNRFVMPNRTTLTLTETARYWLGQHPDEFAAMTGGAKRTTPGDRELLELAEVNRLRAASGGELQTLEGMRAFKKENQ